MIKLTDIELAYKELILKLENELKNPVSPYYSTEEYISILNKKIEDIKRFVPRETLEVLNDIKFDKDGKSIFTEGANISLMFYHSDDLFKEIERHQDELRAMGYAVEIENFSSYHAKGTNIIVRDKTVFSQTQKRNEIIGSALFIGFLVLLTLILYFFL